MTFLRLALAVFRLTILFVKDDQPFFKWLREDWSIWSPYWREAIRCARCAGVWSAIIVMALNKFKLTKWMVDLLALAGAQVIVYDAWSWVKR